MDQPKEWKIMDISQHAVEKVINCSPAFFQKITQGSEPAAETVSGIKIYSTRLLPVMLEDGSEVHAIIVAAGGFVVDLPAWMEENITEPPLFLDWINRRPFNR